MTEAISYPRQEALTRRFRLGAPRGFTPAPDGRRVAFVRSSHGRDAVGSLWVAEVEDGALVERLLVDARTLDEGDTDLPDAERARRERMRETTAGITAFSCDEAVETAVFSLDGALHRVDLRSGATTALATPGAVVDPRLSPDGQRVAFVCDASLYVIASDGSTPAVLLAQSEAETDSWGLADFIAAEELDRIRGLWWLSTSDAVLAERVDEADVAVRWIADPAHPERAPRPHRYPAAGTANPDARLFVITVAGDATEAVWDRAAYPYLASVHPDHAGDAVVSVLSRDQRRQQVLSVAADATVTVLRERECAPWITMQGGVPCLLPDGRLLEIAPDEANAAFRLLADGVALTPASLQVTGVAHADDERIVITAQPDPFNQGVYAVDGQAVTAITDAPGVHSVACATGGMVIASTRPDTTGTRYVATLTAGGGEIASVAETPVVSPTVSFHRIGARELAVAVLLPSDHVPGSRRLPVVMAPYGGPHHSRVVHAASAFASDQWLADQGFAVVVVDGAGTPGRGPAVEFEIVNDLARTVLEDQVAGLRGAAELHPDLDLDRVGITGWSFGGYLAALAVLDRPDVFHVAVAGAPVTDWALYDTAYTERYLGLPQDNPDAYAATSLLARAEQLSRPLLIIHGLADDNVLVAHSLQLSSALLAAGRPHSVLPLSGVTHMAPQEIVAENLLRLEVAFLAEHLQGAQEG